MSRHLSDARQRVDDAEDDAADLATVLISDRSDHGAEDHRGTETLRDNEAWVHEAHLEDVDIERATLSLFASHFLSP